MINGHIVGSHMDFTESPVPPARINGAASKNGHAIPTVNGLAFEDGARVGMTGFDHEHMDREFIEQQREIGRREARMDVILILRECFDLISGDKNPILGVESYTYACGLSTETEVEIGLRHGLGKAAVSKRVKQWQRLLGALGLPLPPAAAMRTEKACKSFKEATANKWKTRTQSVNRIAPKPLASLQAV
jgi:hypothetical protein